MDTELVSIIMPTMRPQRSVDTIQQTLAASSGHDLEFIVVTEDEATRDAVMAYLLACEYDIAGGFQILYREEPQGPMVAWNDGLRVSHGTYVTLWADDVWPHPGWLDKAMPYFDRFPGRIGLVGFNDLLRNGNVLITHFVAHRQYIIEHQGGVLAFPHYARQYTDVESTDRAKRSSIWAWAEDAVVEHLHYSVNKRRADKYDRLVSIVAAEDKRIYQQRKAQGFPDDFEPVML